MPQIGGLDDVALGKACVDGACDPLEVEARRSLHPGVGDQDPDGAEMGTEADHAGGKEVRLGAYLVPAEEEQG